MDILPILSTLRRHKVTSTLIVLEIALTCAIVCNAVFLINQRMHRMDMPSGVAMHELVQVQVSTIGSQADGKARTQADLAALRQIPGVQAVALTNELPFTNSSSNTSILLTPTQMQPTLNATFYNGEGIAQTLGTKLVAGHWFRPEEYLDFDYVLTHQGNLPDSARIVIVTRAMAARLWPGKNPLGQTFWMGNQIQMRVVGVVDSLIRPSLAWGDNTSQWSMIFPLRLTVGQGASYVLRSAPQDRQRIITAAVAALKKLDPKRVVTEQRTLDDARNQFYQGDRAMTHLLIGVIVALLLVTGLGIVGLASFWVAQRRHTIGVRRALGATRANILRYFQTENFLIVTFGIVLGMALAYGLSVLLMTQYEVPRLPLWYLPIGAIALWLIGQLAVLGPALRAAAVPPVVATRSV